MMYTAEISSPGKKEYLEIWRTRYSASCPGGFNEASFSIREKTDIKIFSDVKIFYKTEVVWAGYVVNLTWGQGFMEVRCLGNQGKLSERGISRSQPLVASKNFTVSDWIRETLIPEFELIEGKIEPCDYTIIAGYTIASEGWTSYTDILARIGRVEGRAWFIWGDYIDYLKIPIEPDVYEINAGDCLNYELDIDASKYANRAVVGFRADGETLQIVTVDDGDAQKREGVIVENWIDAGSYITEDAAKGIGELYVSSRARPLWRGSLEVSRVKRRGVEQPLHRLKPGYKVIFNPDGALKNINECEFIIGRTEYDTERGTLRVEPLEEDYRIEPRLARIELMESVIGGV